MPDQKYYGDKYFNPEEPSNEETEGDKLEKSGEYIDTGELDNEGNPQLFEALQIAQSEGPHALNESQQSLLINSGYDDFVRGGNTQSPVGDLATLAVSAVAAKPLAGLIASKPLAAAGTALDIAFPPTMEEALLTPVAQKFRHAEIGKRLLRPIWEHGKPYVQSKLNQWFSSKRFATANGADSLDVVKNEPLQASGGTGNQKNPDITPNITKANERTLKRMGLWEAFREFDVDEFGGKVTRKQGKAIVTPEIQGFTKVQAERLGKLPELRSFYRNLTDAEIIPELDHINPLKLTAYLMDKTTGAQRVGIRQIILDEGIYLGEMVENFRALPREVHAVWTRNMNRIMHKQLDTFLAEMSSLGITKPEDIAREYVRRIKDANVKFDKIYEAHKRTYGTVTDSNVDDLISKLDDAYELGDDWAPARTRETRRDINTDLSNLDETPLNVLPEGNEGLNRVVNQLGLDDVTDIDMKEFSKLSLSDQMNQLEKRSGMNIGEIQQLLQSSDVDLQTILDMIE